MSIPILFFFFRTVLSIWGPLRFYLFSFAIGYDNKKASWPLKKMEGTSWGSERKKGFCHLKGKRDI